MNALKILISVSFLLGCLDVFAFDEKTIIYKPDSGGTEIKLTYKGEVIEPAYDVISQKGNVNKDVRPFVDFFRLMYEANMSGKKERILALWNPAEHQRIELDMDEESIKENTARFKALNGFRLKTIVQYGAFYLCFIETDFGDQGVYTMKFTVSKKGEKFNLTKALHGDYFYENISHYMDKTNYTKQLP